MAACILPIALVAAMLVYIPYERERILVRDSSISRTRGMVSALDRDFARIEAALWALGTSPFLTSNNLADFHAQASQALQNIDADSIVLLDASGQMLLTTRRPFGEPLPRLDYAPLLQRIAATGKPGVSDLYPGPLAGDLLVRIGVPVRRGGLMAYTLYATIAPERLAAVLADQNLPQTWRAAIADSSGNVVARSHEVDKFLGKPVMPEVLQRMNKSNEDAFEAKTLDGIPVLTAYSRSRAHDWTAVVGTPLAELNADIRLTFSWLLAATCVALAIGITLAWLIGGRIAYSISALVAPAQALGSGKAVVVPPLYLEEAVALGKALTKSSLVLHDATQKLERSIADLEEFAFVASHDLKTPLRAISGYVQLLEKDHGPGLERKAIALVRRAARAAHRLDQLTNDLLSYARVDSRGRSSAVVEFGRVLDEAIKLLDSPIRKAGATITAGELPAIIGDHAQLVQLMQNLIGNAIKYCGKDPPRIHVAAGREQGQWTFSVSDNCIGIEAKHHERIFEMFRRLHSQREYPGTGIGLSVCRRIVHRHGGRIWVESRPGEGSTFFFTIPDHAGMAP